MTTLEKILKEIDFLSDHWVKGDDRPPFSFGGWREEVGANLVAIFNQELKTLLEECVEMGNTLEKVEVPTEEHECHLNCCGKCWCEQNTDLVKLSDYQSKLREKINNL